MILTNREIRTIKNLSEAKVRKAEGAFKAEGTKCVLDTISHFELRALIATSAWFDEHPDMARLAAGSAVCLPAREMERVSSLQTPSDVVAVYSIPESPEASYPCGLTVVVDGVQDPGNMGTILRTCDWFGVRNVVCSPKCVDVYNPKVVQSTMGAISRIRVATADLPAYIKAAPKSHRVFGTFLDGDSIYEVALPDDAIIVVGNEGRGISPELGSMISDRLFIPPYPAEGSETSESLNVATATAIVVAMFRRQSAAGAAGSGRNR